MSAGLLHAAPDCEVCALLSMPWADAAREETGRLFDEMVVHGVPRRVPPALRSHGEDGNR